MSSFVYNVSTSTVQSSDSFPSGLPLGSLIWREDLNSLYYLSETGWIQVQGDLNISNHRTLPYQNIHVAYSLEYSDSTARENAVGLSSTDIGRIARQTSDNSFWILKNNFPLIWLPINSTSISNGKVRIDSSDAIDGYLAEKLTTGPELRISIVNPGGNEKLVLDSYGEIRTSTTDTTLGYLYDKLQAGTNIVLTKQNIGGNENISISSTGGGLSPTDHETLRQLIHFIDEGPATGFGTEVYKETTGTVFPTAMIWYDKPGVGRKKIVSKEILWSGAFPATITWKIYDTSETVLATVLDIITYSGPFEISIERSLL